MGKEFLIHNVKETQFNLADHKVKVHTLLSHLQATQLRATKYAISEHSN